MVRTQIQLTDDQSKRLKALAARKGISVSDLIRQGVDTILTREADESPEERMQRAIQAAGMFRSSQSDVARHHDEYLGGAFSQ